MDPRFGFCVRLFAGALASGLAKRFDKLFNSLVLLPQLVGVAGDFVLGQLVGHLPDLLPLLLHGRNGLGALLESGLLFVERVGEVADPLLGGLELAALLVQRCASLLDRRL